MKSENLFDGGSALINLNAGESALVESKKFGKTIVHFTGYLIIRVNVEDWYINFYYHELPEYSYNLFSSVTEIENIQWDEGDDGSFELGYMLKFLIWKVLVGD